MFIKNYIYENRKEIDDIYLHDSFLENIIINVSEKKIDMNINWEWPKHKECNLCFEKVVYFKFDRLDFWGDAGDCICDIYLGEDDFAEKYMSEKIKKEQLEAKKKKCSEPINIFKTNKFITVCIQLLSGDIEIIICEKMIFIDNE